MLQDYLKRNITYVRISLTEKCNFSCEYCLPGGWDKKLKDTLSVNELDILLATLKELGVKKIRFSGGEPALFKDLTKVLEITNHKYKFESCGLTTNGFNLLAKAEEWYKAGLRNINVSIDSLDPKKFFEITKVDILDKIIAGIKHAIHLGFNIKINAVILQGINTQDMDDFISFANTHKVTIRFIELMQNNTCTVDYLNKRQLTAETIIEDLKAKGWTLDNSEDPKLKGPAQTFKHQDNLGKIGFITPYAQDFCSTCNRIRFSSLGEILLCLFGKKRIPLRHLLTLEKKEELKAEIETLLISKPKSHHLDENFVGACDNLSKIGG